MNIGKMQEDLKRELEIKANKEKFNSIAQEVRGYDSRTEMNR